MSRKLCFNIIHNMKRLYLYHAVFIKMKIIVKVKEKYDIREKRIQTIFFFSVNYYMINISIIYLTKKLFFQCNFYNNKHIFLSKKF